MSNRAWVTLATNDSYSLGALVLAHSLRRAGSVYPAVVLITPSVTEAMRERLSAVFAEVQTVDVLDSRDITHLALLQRPELGITFTKIHCWGITQYDKCVFLDADTLIIQNCDELFDREELSAAPDVGWPDCFNSGVFVYKPSQETFEKLIKFAQERGSFDGGDQGLLNSFFSDWAQGDINKHLPFLYNVTSAAFYSYLPALKHYGQNLKIIHFIGPAKPWLQQFNWETRSVDAPEHLREFLQLWWDLFAAQVHSQLDVAMVEREDAPAVPPLDISHHYEPVVDPDSEFPWHHPGAEIFEAAKPEIDMTQFYDPWQLYRGNIPPKEAITTPIQTLSGKMDDYEEVKEYAWKYHPFQSPSQHIHYETQSNHEHSHQSEKHCHHDSSQAHQFSDDHTAHYTHDSHLSHYEHLHEDSKNCHQEHVLITDLVKNETKTSKHVHIYYHELPTIHKDSQEENIVEKSMINEELSESECDFYEELIPRHPYDGFYLKHRTVIDSHGKKMCIHEIPPTPSPSPPPYEISDDEFLDNLSNTVPEDVCLSNGYGNQTGVAGNLARVVATVGNTQREAIDELSRRQGWEAGNIDYMGADSFDNIWAKISSTLNQTKSPSPPKEPSPVEVTKEVVDTPVLKEVADVIVPQETVILPAQKEVLVTKQPVEVPTAQETVDSKIQKAVEVPAAIDSANTPVAQVSSDVSVVQEAVDIAVAKEAVDVPVEKEVIVVKGVAKESDVPVSTPVDSLAASKSEAAEPAVPKSEVPQPAIVADAPLEIPATIESIAVLPSTEVPLSEIPATVEAVASPIVPAESAAASEQLEIPAPVEACEGETPATETPALELPKEESTENTELVLPPTPPVSPKSTPEVSTPKNTTPVEPAIDVVEVAKEAVPEPVEKSVVPEATPASPPSVLSVTPEKSLEAGSESPPLAHTPSKGEAPIPTAAKSEERRKVAGKLRLHPPSVADALPTPDSELEDAASLASSIIAGELTTPTVSSPSPTASPASPPAALQPHRLSVDDPELPTPPVGAATVSLAQIGVKPKPKSTIAAQIESSLTDKPTAPTTDAPKKKIIKKVVKKDKDSTSGDVPAPVPPPRKKEKKPKEK